MCALACFGLTQGALAQQAKDFPNRPIKIVVPYPPGGGSDSLVRQVASYLTKKLGSPVIVDNKPGANTILATEYVSKQPANGYTLLYVDSAFTINPALYKLRYSPIEDLAPVAMITEIPLVILANNDVPYRGMKEVLDAARAHPEKLSYASYGLGSRAHLAGEMLGSVTNTRMLHVPFKGSADALTNVIGKQVDLAISTIEPALPLIRTGKVRAIAVTTPQRTAALPDTPTIAETVPGFSTVGWGGIVAPKGIDAGTLKLLADAINEAIQSHEMRERFAQQGVESKVRSPEFMRNMIRTEVAKWGALVKSANVKVD
jgi:tripartite-type tricarboxylate transporter receptor subunit TctC